MLALENLSVSEILASKHMAHRHLGESEMRFNTDAIAKTIQMPMKAAVKLLYPLLAHELRERGYSEAEVIHRLRECCSQDIELLDIISATILELDELCH